MRILSSADAELNKVLALWAITLRAMDQGVESAITLENAALVIASWQAFVRKDASFSTESVMQQVDALAAEVMPFDAPPAPPPPPSSCSRSCIALQPPSVTL